MKFSNLAIAGVGLLLAKSIYKDYKEDKEKAAEEKRRIESPIRFTDY